MRGLHRPRTTTITRRMEEERRMIRWESLFLLLLSMFLCLSIIENDTLLVLDFSIPFLFSRFRLVTVFFSSQCALDSQWNNCPSSTLISIWMRRELMMRWEGNYYFQLGKYVFHGGYLSRQLEGLFNIHSMVFIWNNVNSQRLLTRLELHRSLFARVGSQLSDIAVSFVYFSLKKQRKTENYPVISGHKCSTIP